MDAINIKDIMPMQDELRDNKQIFGMVQFVKEGNFWTEEITKQHAEKVGKIYGPIYLTRFPDQIACHDGHHRIMATLLGGRKYLREDEYIIVDWKYEDYDAVWFNRGYVTPYDPKTEVRLPDFMAFKAKVLKMALDNSEKKALEYIYANKNLYARKKKLNTFSELAHNFTIQHLLDFDEPGGMLG